MKAIRITNGIRSVQAQLHTGQATSVPQQGKHTTCLHALEIHRVASEEHRGQIAATLTDVERGFKLGIVVFLFFWGRVSMLSSSVAE